MDKVNLQQLAKLLAAKKNMTQKDAEAFLGQFFDAIIENIATEKVVKIKGFGTFKLIEVLDRESVNVNTGERIVIPGHSKISFTPDAAVKDLINKPFSDFPTVIINEGTNIEDMERIDVSQQESFEEDEPEEVEEETVEETISPEESEVVPEPVPMFQPASEPEPPVEEMVFDEPIPKSAPEEELLLDEPLATTEPVAPAQPEVVVQVRALTFVETCALVLGTLLLCVLSYFAGYHRLLCPDSGNEAPLTGRKVIPAALLVPADSVVQPDTVVPLPADSATQPLPVAPDSAGSVAHQHSTSIPTKHVAPTDSLKPSTPQTPQVKTPTPEVKKPTLSPNARYRITGTRRLHRVKPGEYLTLIAVREYGSKSFAKYIIEHNGFKNPDNIPLNSEIKLPELEEMQ